MILYEYFLVKVKYLYRPGDLHNLKYHLSLYTWSGFEAAKTAAWQSRGLHHWYSGSTDKVFFYILTFDVLIQLIISPIIF